MTFINNLTAIFSPAKTAVQSKPVFRGIPAAEISFQNETGLTADSYTSNPLYDMLGSEADLQKAAMNSAVIRDNCKKLGIPVQVHFDVFEDMV